MSKHLSARWLHAPVRPFHLLILCLFTGLLLPANLTAANRTAQSLGGVLTTFPGGNFEAPALPASPGYQYRPAGTGWILTGGAGLTRNNTGFTAGNPNAPQGAQVMFLQNISRARQSIDLVAGYYTFHIKAAQRGNHQTSSQTIEIRVDGNTVQSITPGGTNYQSFISVPVALSSGSHTVEVRGMAPNPGDNTVFVDEFRYTRVKELLLSGFESPVLPTSPGYQYSPGGGPWIFTSGGGLTRSNTGFTASNPAVPQGSQALFLQGGGSATMPVSISKTGFYRFRFKAAIRGNNPTQPAAKNIRLTIGSTEIGEFPLLSSSWAEKVSLAMYLTPGTYNLQLKGVNPLSGDHTGFVDDLRLEMIHDWQDPYAWIGNVPNGNDIATIPANSAMGMRGTLTTNRTIVNGHLVGAQNQNVNIFAKNILVMGGSALFELGQDLAPYPKDANITLTATVNDPDINAMGTKFLGAMGGGTIHLHGLEKKSWSQLGLNVNAGSNQIRLKETVNWKVGDEILIVSSRKNWNEAEKRTITGISGAVLTLNANLAYPHKGVLQSYSDGSRTWPADLRAEVGLLSHNIKVEGASPGSAGFGGHIMIMNNSKAYVGGVELYNMGQKAILGRYPFHWHMLGNVGVGQYFKNSSVHQSYNRAITIHGTESTLVENNFFYDHIGHGVFLEDGSERFNVIRKNVTLLSKRPAPGEELTPSDNQFNQVQNRTPSSYWITNPQNTFEYNVAAGTEGTGYWFAFPTKPMGASATDPRFSGLQPHTLPLISFKGNSAHSCMSGFDIFDQLNPDHSLKTNWGWAHNGNHYMDDCLWYANDLALYSGIGVGGPSDNLIFRNNVFVENKVGTMFASYSIVDGSVFVANSGQSLLSGQRYAYRVYDGAGQVHNSHFIGWNASNANFLLNTGAATKHPNHILTSNTTNHSGTVRCVLPDFDIPPVTAHANHPAHPRFWSIVLRDVDGGISGLANSSIVCNQPFVLVGDEFQPSNWTRVYRTPRHYVLSKLTYDLPSAQHPNVVATRTKAGTPSPSVYYVDGFKEHHQLPFIVNDGFEYTYQYEALPSSKIVRMYMDDATAGDDYIARFKDFGKLGGLNMSSTQGSFTSHGSLTSLRNANSSGYYRQSGGDLYVKAVATGKVQRFDIRWSSNFTVPKLDTDGDEMADGKEISLGRHPFDAFDLAAEFNSNSDFEGWTGFSNISGQAVSGGVLKGTSINNGDAQIRNNAYNFDPDRVPKILVRMKASSNTTAQIFFATSTAPGYSASRVVSASYSGNGAFQTLTFHMNNHAAWNNTITSLRFDVVSGAGKYFEVDWIRADGAAKAGNESFVDAGSAVPAGMDAGVSVYPNPMQDLLHLDLGAAGIYEKVRIADLQGRILRESSIDAQVSKMDWSLGDAALPPGVYLVQLIGPGLTTQVKVVKLAGQ